ncbi:hypothetical protein N7532_002556 [Penicillium argentinense]|uniref:NADP-dependent oxidoreductase domain-containing protein n=1 Tax=Penicillium argentinense TaxID=1131581 RepID=A0A9W9G0S4_9EURO|nr:uncharacterized protein N7532_002556 [Penicillium argentinense]KAJ5109911.1 hypothetical protein N7532_002556 [Penicillium argentinense]
MSSLANTPKPKSPLGYHRLLAPSAGVRVSPLCLGTANFGEAWKEYMGECSRETAFSLLDQFFDNGGNFIDTANSYQAGESEVWVGDWMAERGVRDQIVLATKYTSFYPGPGEKLGIRANYQGNNTKSLKLSVDASLKKLKTDYIDLLYVHWWDFTSSIEEVMQSLNNLVAAGKVLYLGISDAPAWVVSKANQYARDHGLRTFSVYQGRWSAACRDFERDIIPMAKNEGIALAPWGALGSGNFKSEQQRQSDDGRRFIPPTEAEIAVAKVLEQIGDKRHTLITSVALAYVMHKAPYVFPVVGGRRIEHLKGNIEALSLELSEEEIDEIDAATPFDVGFPLNFLLSVSGAQYKLGVKASEIGMVKLAAYLDIVQEPQPIKPRKI